MESEQPTHNTHPQDSDAIDRSWQFVVDDLTQSALEYIKVDDSTRAELTTNFWQAYATLLEQAEKDSPGISKLIINRTKAISNERRLQENETFEEVTLLQRKRRARARGFMQAFRFEI